VKWKVRREIPHHFSETRHLDSSAYHFSLAAFEIPSKSLSVRFTVSLRNDEVSHYTPDRLLARPPKDGRSAIIPIGYNPVGFHDNYGIERGLQDRAQIIPSWIQVIRSRIAND